MGVHLIEGEPPRILVIDDDEMIAGTIASFLKTSGFDVLISLDGEDGLSRAREEKPDLVILDIMMPGKSGIEVMEDMRLDLETENIPILFVTSVGDEATVVRGLKGADDYMVKPILRLELEARVLKILERTAKESGGGDRREVATHDRIAIRVGNETYLVPMNQIFHIEASGKYCFVCTKSRQTLCDYSISEMETLLDPARFLRVHRSSIVNLNHIMKITREQGRRVIVVMGDDKHTRVRVADSHMQDFKDRLGL